MDHNELTCQVIECDICMQKIEEFQTEIQNILNFTQEKIETLLAKIKKIQRLR
jgi:hypothetical protein